MKEITLTVKVKFEDDIKNLESVVTQVRKALVSWTDSKDGLVGENDTYTKGINVSANVAGKTIEEKWTLM